MKLKRLIVLSAMIGMILTLGLSAIAMATPNTDKNPHSEQQRDTKVNQETILQLENFFSCFNKNTQDPRLTLDEAAEICSSEPEPSDGVSISKILFCVDIPFTDCTVCCANLDCVGTCDGNGPVY